MNMKEKIGFLVLVVFVIFHSAELASADEMDEASNANITSTFTPTFVPTPTVSGVHIYVPEKANVRSGPGTFYEKIGVLVAGQISPVVGRTSVGEWIAINYPEGSKDVAWVYAPLVLVRGMIIEDLPEINAPPTPTLEAVPIEGLSSISTDMPSIPVRLPTFTQSPPIAQPTFVTVEYEDQSLPPIVLIGSLFVLGIISGMVAIVRQRR